jgi:RIO kinase 1
MKKQILFLGIEGLKRWSCPEGNYCQRPLMYSDKFLDEKSLKKLDREIEVIINRHGLDRKTLDEVFDKTVLHSLEKLISDEYIEILDFPISTGKEGNVFRGVTSDKKFVAVKIYRTSNATFKHISKYIIGDPRFVSVHNSKRDIIYSWTQKEYKNLKRLEEAGIRAPKPIVYTKNILIMQYIGSAYKPAPMLKDYPLKYPKKTFDELISFVSKMYKKSQMVHADLSAFNILMYRNKPYLIDLGQGVLLEHPNALEFLKRDIQNIVTYFRKYNIKADENKIFEKLVHR